MRVGTVYPQGELHHRQTEPAEFARNLEACGFAHVLAYDHVLGADASSRADWAGPYDVHDEFDEPLVLFAHLAAITTVLELTTGVLILPQRQTALVAKQVATLDLLSGGRVRLGVGIGWNEVEYAALGMTFADRASRYDEQLGVLRNLWSEPVVEARGRHHHVDRAGIAPRPGRAIPLWLGTRGYAVAPLKRIGAVADGWMPLLPPGPDLDRAKGIVAEACRAHSRDPHSLGLEGRVPRSAATSAARVAEAVDEWREAGATHVTLDTSKQGRSLIDHLHFLEDVAAHLDLEAPE